MAKKTLHKPTPRVSSRTPLKASAKAVKAAERQRRKSSRQATNNEPVPAQNGLPTADFVPDEPDAAQKALEAELPDMPENAAESEGGATDAVAELEAVVGMADDEEPAEKREAEEPSNFLAMYFRDMARLAVLRPQEEFESARKIEGLEIAVWARMLSYAPVVDHVLKVCERTLENSIAEFKTLRACLEASRKKPTRQAQEKLERSVLKVAERLRTLDVDKRILDVVLQELKKIFRGLPGKVIDDKIEFSPKSKAFKSYLREVAASYNRAHGSKNEFVKANLRLVVSIARRFNYGRMPLADLIQEGNIGLIKAVERYDYRRG